MTGKGEPLTSPRWWGVEHRCGDTERQYPTLHWADEPEQGVGPRRAFQCDACGDRYVFIPEREAAAATPSLDKIRAALSLARSMILSREPMSAQANAVFEEAFASMGERDAAPTSPSLPDARLLRYALLDLAGLDYAYEARLDSGDYGLLERPNEFAGRLVEAYAAALARLDEGSATPDQGKGEPR